MSYQMALQCAHEVLYLFSKARKNVRELLDPSDVRFSKCLHNADFFIVLQNEIDSIRLRTDDYEMIVVQKLNYTIIVIQESPRALLLRQEQQTIADAGIVEEKHDS